MCMHVRAIMERHESASLLPLSRMANSGSVFHSSVAR